jgi:hypothetical protein
VSFVRLNDGPCIFFVSVTVNCGARINENCTYFESTGSEVGACKVTICRCNSNVCQVISLYRGKFHQPNVLVQIICQNQFHQQNFVKLYKYIQLELTHNFYALCCALYTGNKLSVILLTKKLLIK